MAQSGPPADWADGIAFSPAGRAWIFPVENVIFTQARAFVAAERDVNKLFELFAWLQTQIPEASSPTVVHDWRSFRSFPRPVRAAFVAARKRFAATPRRVVLAAQLNPLLRMALQTAALAAQMLSHAVPVDFVDDPFAVLVRLGVGAPDPALHLRLRLDWEARSS